MPGQGAQAEAQHRSQPNFKPERQIHFLRLLLRDQRLDALSQLLGAGQPINAV